MIGQLDTINAGIFGYFVIYQEENVFLDPAVFSLYIVN